MVNESEPCQPPCTRLPSGREITWGEHMSILSRLFGGGGGGGASAPDPVTHEGFTIFPEPMKDGPRYRIAARIEKEIGGEVKVHQLIRADTLESLDVAIDVTINKAKQVIDEQGDGIFR